MFNSKYDIEYVDSIETGYAAKCVYPIVPMIGTCKIMVSNKYKGDVGLLAHEVEHVHQYSKNPLHAAMYKWCSWYKYKCEITAYRVQTRMYGYKETMEYEWIVNAIINKYGIKKSKEQILKDLVN